MRAVFLDRDGTITVGTPTIERVDSVDKVQLLPDTITALTELARLDYLVFIVTNQASLAERRIDWPEFERINNRILELLAPSDITITKTYVCPHGEGADCDCRKPKPKLLFEAAKQYDIDLSRSWMIGDRITDVQCAVNAGARGILVKTGDPQAHTEQAAFEAKTLSEAIQFIKAQE